VIAKAAAPTIALKIIQALPPFRAVRALNKILPALIPENATEYFTFELLKRLVVPIDYIIERSKETVGLPSAVPADALKLNPSGVLNYIESIGAALNAVVGEAWQDVQDVELDLRRAAGLAEGQSRLREGFSDFYEFVTGHEAQALELKQQTADRQAIFSGALQPTPGQVAVQELLSDPALQAWQRRIEQEAIAFDIAQALSWGYLQDMIDPATGMIRAFPLNKEDP
jgi:hypothetical protein